MSSRRKIITAFVLSLAGGVLFAAAPSEQIHAIGGTGYFSGQRAEIGSPAPGQNDVIPRTAIPSWVYNGAGNDKQQFINWLDGKVDQGNFASGQEEVGGAFIVNTMLKHSRSERSKRVTWSMWNELVDRIMNPDVRMIGVWGDPNNRGNGRNSFYDPVGTGQDDFFNNFNSSPRDLIIFEDTSGTDLYVLQALCANPVGGLPGLPESNEFRMTGRTRVNGGNSAEVLPGDTVRFRHRLTNQGPDETNPDSISWRTRNQNNNVVDSGNAGTFNDGQSKNRGAENITVPAGASPGTEFCRRIQFNPRTHNGGTGNSAERCAEVGYDFDLEPRINVTITDADGQDVTADGVAEVGYTVEFRYSVRNSGLTESQSVDCDYRREAHSGYSTNAPSNGFVPPGASCPPDQVFPRSSTTQIASESLSGGAVSTNTTICRDLSINPATQNGGTERVQACVPVVAKPYSRVFGGDVSVGNGLSTAPNVCTNNSDAAVAGWNRRSAGNFAGAGAQYATFAMDAIRDFSTALGNSGGAPPPSGLAFANTGVPTNESSGLYGGEFGSAPCIPDYYATRPSDATPLGSSVNLTSLNSGTYARDGDLTFDNPGGGIPQHVNPGEEITVYVDGDAFITDSIDYPGNWNVDNMPVFRLIVNGNIYLENGISRVAGIFIAQGDGSSGGVIHTCATSMAPLPLDGDLYDICNNKLTINGAFIANQVRLLRTNGTLSQSNAGDSAPGGGAAGEVFNFNPTLWIKQPPAPAGEGGEYDAIIGLPPVL